MLPDRRTSEDEVCPIRDELLGELYRADENRVSDLVATITPDIRARLALASAFVTRRAVTLATSPLRKMLPINNGPDEEGCEPV